MNNNFLNCIARPPLVSAGGGGGDEPTWYMLSTGTAIVAKAFDPGTLDWEIEWWMDPDTVSPLTAQKVGLGGSNQAVGYLSSTGYGYWNSAYGGPQNFEYDIASSGKVNVKFVGSGNNQVDMYVGGDLKITKAVSSTRITLTAALGTMRGKLYTEKYTIDGTVVYDVTMDAVGAYDAVSEAYVPLEGSYSFAQDE